MSASGREPGNVHHSAQDGYSAVADTYRRGRPDYPPETAAWLTGDLALGHGRRVLDLGAGTGKFVPYLLATGASVLALEPVAAMRAELASQFPGVGLVDGTAQAIALPDNAADCVVCAQSFHWFATPAALSEIRRVLSPGGTLGLIWNVRDEREPWVAALSAIINAREGDAPRYHSGEWRRLFPAPGFSQVGERHAANPHVGPAENVILDRTMSVSFIAALPAAERAKVGREVRSLIAATPALTGKREVAYPYETAMFAFRKEGGEVSA